MAAEEEIYKRSDSIEYLLQKRMSFVVRQGMSLLFLGALVVILLTWFVHAPEVAEAPFTLSSSSPPKALLAKVNGRVTRCYVKDKDTVQVGDLLCQLENLANLDELKKLEKQLEQVQLMIDHSNLDPLRKIGSDAFLNLGELQSVYEGYKKATNALYLAVSDRQYRQQKDIISKRLEALEKLYQNLLKQRDIYNLEYKLAREAYEADSNLNSKRSISRTELRNSESNALQRQLALISLQQSIISNENSRNDIREQLLMLERSFEQQKTDFIQAHQQMKAALREWKSKFLLIAPVSGILSVNRNIYEGLNVQAGEPLFYIVAPGSELVAEVLLPQDNLGKVKVGQEVILKFDSYNYEEYGVVNAFVYNVSDIPQEAKTAEGSTNLYLVQLAFKNGLNTSYHKSINPRYGLSGKASIVLDDKNLLSKLFLDKFKALFER